MTASGRILFVLFLISAPVAAQVDVSPAEIAGATKVDAEGLVELVQTQERLVVVDSRITSDRAHGYIEDSISLPDIHTDCDSLKKLAADRATPILFYCNGPKCGRSGKAVKKAIACGYTRLYWFRGGFEEWRIKGYPTIKDR